MLSAALRILATTALGGAAGFFGGVFGVGAGALAFSAMASTYPAARFATALDPRGLRLAFATFLVILAAIIAYRTRRGSSRQPDRDPLPWGWSVPLGIVGGIVSGLFGVGGALIVPPALTAFFGVRQVEGQGLGLALVAPGSVIALVAYAGAGQVDWRLGIPLAVGGVVAISAGVAFTHSLPERRGRDYHFSRSPRSIPPAIPLPREDDFGQA